MSLFDRFRPAGPQSEESARRQRDIVAGLHGGRVSDPVAARLDGARHGRLPWTATLTPAELMVVRSHGLRPIASVSATCWMHYGWSWTEGHAEGWNTALRRLRDEAEAAGANAVLDVKMRTVPLAVENSMDFTLVGTAVFVEGLAPAALPVVATVPTLEFVKLLEADVVPTGIAVGAQYDWLDNWSGSARQSWMGNIESAALSGLLAGVRQRSRAELRRSAETQGNGVLAHVDFSELFEFEGGENQPRRYLARHIVIGTTVDARSVPFLHDIGMVIDLRAGATPLAGTRPHHQSYALGEDEGGI